MDRFSGGRIAYVLCGVSALLLPVHFFVSCEVSGALAGSACLIFPLTFLLCRLTPTSIQARFQPVAFSFGLLVLHAATSH